MAKRKQFRVLVTLSAAPGVTRTEAIREMRTRTNDLCCYNREEDEVRVRKIEGAGR